MGCGPDGAGEWGYYGVVEEFVLLDLAAWFGV